jgi:hypothetical protein
MRQGLKYRRCSEMAWTTHPHRTNLQLQLERINLKIGNVFATIRRGINISSFPAFSPIEDKLHFVESTVCGALQFNTRFMQGLSSATNHGHDRIPKDAATVLIPLHLFEI